VEDQPTDSGDLSTDPAATGDTPANRARHRMPRGKERRSIEAEPAEAQETPEGDEISAVEATPSAAVESTSTEADEATAKPRRRWNLLRRKKNQPAAAAAEDAATDGELVAAEPADETEGETTEAEDVTANDEPVLVPHQPPGRRLKVAAVAAAALFVAGGAFLGATVQPVIANRALVDTKLNIARTAANAITTLWSYTPENMDSLAARSARYLGGDFAFQYRKFIDSIVATNKQAQVTNATSVLGTAVESVTSTEASAIVYTNSVATSPVSKNIPSLRYLSYRLEMKRDRADWRITRMTTVTTLDLTPQL
jgi:Mce-associated membrane protein